MSITRRPRPTLLGLAVACFFASSLAWLNAGQVARGQVPIDPDDIGGVVTSEKGPEAGVWVVAETKELPTKFIKIVVTDDQGRYVMPDLPGGKTYDIWVRGYGLVDSTPVKSMPGKQLNLTAKVAATPQEAALIYPPDYWLSLVRVPAATEFPGTGDAGNGISVNMKTQEQYIHALKGCILCHQVGQRATREIPAQFSNLSSFDAWDHRVQSGQRGVGMSGRFTAMGRRRTLQMMADWTERIKAGEVPPAPPRPKGVERNIVVTMWDWANDGKVYLHDSIATDKRNPTVNAHGLVYGTDVAGTDRLTWVDPLESRVGEIKVPFDPKRPPFAPRTPQKYQSTFWGEEMPYDSRAGVHTPAMDGSGRVWFTTTQRGADNPEWCYDGSNKFSKYYPMKRSGNDKQIGLYDPRNGQMTTIDICTGTHHLEFATNKENTLWFSNPDDGWAIGWIDTATWDATHDAKKSTGWCPAVLDTNGDGKITQPWTEIGEKFDPTKDLRHDVECYGIGVDPKSGAAWCAPATYPGFIVRVDRGSNPPESCKAEAYHTPPSAHAFTPRGINVDTNGIVWANFSGSGQVARFDRSQCKVMNGPKVADGLHCPEGWTFYDVPSPKLAGTNVPADWSYQQWVDQQDIFGLGKNVPITNGTNSDSLMAFLPDKKEWVVLRVPYPIGFYSRLHDGRIDDPRTGWKGRALWSQYATGAIWQTEGEQHRGIPGGKETASKAVKFQLRPNPLAK